VAEALARLGIEWITLLGFVASILLILGIGAALDLLTAVGSAQHPLAAFRGAFAL